MLADAQVGLGDDGDAAAAASSGIDRLNDSFDPRQGETPQHQAAVAHMATVGGEAWIRIKEYGIGISMLESEAEIDPDKGLSYARLCTTLSDIGRTDGADEACRKAITADPSRPDAYFVKGWATLAAKTTGPERRVAADALRHYL